MKLRRFSTLIARSPRLTAVIVWVVWRRCPDARPGLHWLLYRRNDNAGPTAPGDENRPR